MEKVGAVVEWCSKGLVPLSVGVGTSWSVDGRLLCVKRGGVVVVLIVGAVATAGLAIARTGPDGALRSEIEGCARRGLGGRVMDGAAAAAAG